MITNLILFTKIYNIFANLSNLCIVFLHFEIFYAKLPSHYVILKYIIKYPHTDRHIISYFAMKINR